VVEKFVTDKNMSDIDLNICEFSYLISNIVVRFSARHGSSSERPFYEENVPKISAQKNEVVPEILKSKRITHMSSKMIKCCLFWNFNISGTNAFFRAEIFGTFSS